MFPFDGVIMNSYARNLPKNTENFTGGLERISSQSVCTLWYKMPNLHRLWYLQASCYNVNEAFHASKSIEFQYFFNLD